MKDFVILFSIISFKLSSAQAPVRIHFAIIWNVGQGQWVTEVERDYCRHFDVGGEWKSFYRIKSRVLKLCENRKNQLLISHWDEDHIINIPLLARHVAAVCWQRKPRLFSEKRHAQQILALGLPDCPSPAENVDVWTPLTAPSSNESSQVFLSGRLLLPGDSPMKTEEVWAAEMSGLQQVSVLVLAHHGSRTGTGNVLLERLSHLKLAVASARNKKYGHPHRETLNRLRQHNIPTLKTEDWGNIWISL